MRWDFSDQSTGDRAPGGDHRGRRETTYYRLRQRRPARAEGHRAANGARKDERVYLGGFETYRKFGAGRRV